MSKKLITACMALFALAAFALPATASATSPVLTHPTGTALNPKTGECTGVKETICLTGTNIGNTILRSGNTILSECTKATITGYLTKNEGGVIEGTVHTATFTGAGGQDPAEAANMSECKGEILGNTTVTTNGGGVDENTVAKGTPWCMKSNVLGSLTVRGGKCSEAARNIDFIMKSTSIGSCVYTRAAAIPGTYTTDPTGTGTGDVIVSLTPENTEFVLKEGPILCPGKGSLEMKFTMETDETTATPVYIS